MDLQPDLQRQLYAARDPAHHGSRCAAAVSYTHLSYKKDNNALADKIRKEELLLSIALSEYKQVIFDILTPMVEEMCIRDSF